MHCYFINLDRAEGRRASITQSFEENKRLDCRLIRFPAITADFVRRESIPGNLRPNEKACFLSHRAVIEENLKSPDPFMILEDDAVFGKYTFDTLNNLIKSAKNLDWDILFTDICIPMPTTMIELVRLKNQLSKEGEVTVLDLQHLIFAGSTAYVVNPRSTERLLDVLYQEECLDIPYDLFLRKLIGEKKIRGKAVFPFITSLSNYADESQVQNDELAGADLVWNTFRKMIWLDGATGDCKNSLKKIRTDLCDELSDDFGTIISACISGKMISK